MDITNANLAALNVAYNTAFNTRLDGLPIQWDKIAMRVPSTTAANTYPKILEIGEMREFLGERVIERLEMTGFTVNNRKFEKTIGVSRDVIADDQYGIYTTYMSDLGRRAAELPDILVIDQLKSGFDTVGHDGQFFFDTDHPVEDKDGVEQSVSNFQGGAGAAWYLLDTSREIKPLIFQDREPAEFTPRTNLDDPHVFNLEEFLWGARRRCAAAFGAWQLAYASKEPLTETNYEAARTAMGEMTGHKGIKLNLDPNLLVVSAANEGAARRILNAEFVSGGDTNVWKGSAELLKLARL